MSLLSAPATGFNFSALPFNGFVPEYFGAGAAPAAGAGIYGGANQFTQAPPLQSPHFQVQPPPIQQQQHPNQLQQAYHQQQPQQQFQQHQQQQPPQQFQQHQQQQHQQQQQQHQQQQHQQQQHQQHQQQRHQKQHQDKYSNNLPHPQYGPPPQQYSNYDYEEYDHEEGDPNTNSIHVAPIQGPIYLKNGTVPVVPLYSYPLLNNGTFYQIPILWTALSVALGLEIRGEIIRGVPCIKRFHQLFCPTAGNSYPLDRIERFIDDNKALMKRMYGEFQMAAEYGPPAREVFDNKRSIRRRDADDVGPPGVPDLHAAPDDGHNTEGPESFFAKIRQTRQSFRNNQSNESGRVDACESKVEIVTPYWASNSAGKIRAIVNTQHFEQAIHQEVCSKVQTKRCVGDCGCEQKYKWHRLLAYDPDNDCKGIFMDWFLFPSCCVCRCTPFGSK